MYNISYFFPKINVLFLNFLIKMSNRLSNLLSIMIKPCHGMLCHEFMNIIRIYNILICVESKWKTCRVPYPIFNFCFPTDPHCSIQLKTSLQRSAPYQGIPTSLRKKMNQTKILQRQKWPIFVAATFCHKCNCVYFDHVQHFCHLLISQMAIINTKNYLV